MVQKSGDHQLICYVHVPLFTEFRTCQVVSRISEPSTVSSTWCIFHPVILVYRWDFPLPCDSWIIYNNLRILGKFLQRCIIKVTFEISFLRLQAVFLFQMRHLNDDWKRVNQKSVLKISCCRDQLEAKKIHPIRWTYRIWKWWFGRWFSFANGWFLDDF